MECRGRFYYNIRIISQDIFSTHHFSPKQMGNDVIARIPRLRNTFHNKAPLPYVKSLKCCDPACR